MRRINNDINKICEMINTLCEMDSYYAEKYDGDHPLYEYGYGVFDTANGYLGDILQALEDMVSEGEE